jgi:hypothetical protein
MRRLLESVGLQRRRAAVGELAIGRELIVGHGQPKQRGQEERHTSHVLFAAAGRSRAMLHAMGPSHRGVSRFAVRS